MAIRWRSSADRHGVAHDDAINAMLHHEFYCPEFEPSRGAGHPAPDLFIGPGLGGELLEVMVERTATDLVVFHLMPARPKICRDSPHLEGEGPVNTEQDEPVDEDYYAQLAAAFEADDFTLPATAVVHRGGEGAGRAFLAQYMTPDELDAAERRSRGRGRPSLSGEGRSPARQVRLPAELDALLVQRADREGRPLSDVLRAAAEAYLRPPAA